MEQQNFMYVCNTHKYNINIIYVHKYNICSDNYLHYHFIQFLYAIVKILIIKNHRILIFNKFLLKYNTINFIEKTRIKIVDKNCLFSSHRVLKIFSIFLIKCLVLHFFICNFFYQHEKMRH